MSNVFRDFPVRDQEYRELEEKFLDLLHFASWQLIKKNSRNNHTEDEEDISQELKIGLIRAGSHYKRQTYIEDCLRACAEHAEGDAAAIAAELGDLWRQKHKSPKKRFGPRHEDQLDRLVESVVPPDCRPSKGRPLDVGKKFAPYCKAIVWNTLKAVGRKITKEKPIRTGLASLSEFDFLDGQ